MFGILAKESSKARALAPIVFTDEDLEGINLPHSNLLIIKLRIRNAIVSLVLVDGGSSSNIVF